MRAIEKLGDKSRSFAQVAKNAKNVLYIKEAFPSLPSKKNLQIHNIAFSALPKKKIQIMTKGLSRKQVLIPLNSNQIITNGHLLICDWCFRILKGSKMRSLDSNKRCC